MRHQELITNDTPNCDGQTDVKSEIVFPITSMNEKMTSVYFKVKNNIR